MTVKKSQTIVEYAVLIGVIVGALLLMQLYLGRGLSGGIRDRADQVGEQFDPLTASGVQRRQSVSSRKSISGLHKLDEGGDAWSSSRVRSGDDVSDFVSAISDHRKAGDYVTEMSRTGYVGKAGQDAGDDWDGHFISVGKDAEQPGN